MACGRYIYRFGERAFQGIGMVFTGVYGGWEFLGLLFLGIEYHCLSFQATITCKPTTYISGMFASHPTQEQIKHLINDRNRNRPN